MAKPIQDEKFQADLRDYLSGDLPEPERTAFKDRLVNDPDARAEHDFSQRLRFAGREKDLLDVADLAARVTAAPLPPPAPAAAPPKTSWWKSGWMLGLVTVVLLGVAFLAYTGLPAGEDDLSYGTRLAAPFLSEPLEALLITAAGDETELGTGMDAYRSGDYTEAAGLLGAYATRRQDPNAGLYAGVSYLQLGDHELALSFLRLSARRARFPVIATARYYEILALLRGGELDAAAAELARPAPGGLYENEYVKLRQALKNR